MPLKSMFWKKRKTNTCEDQFQQEFSLQKTCTQLWVHRHLFFRPARALPSGTISFYLNVIFQLELDEQCIAPQVLDTLMLELQTSFNFCFHLILGRCRLAIGEDRATSYYPDNLTVLLTIIVGFTEMKFRKKED